MFFENYYYYWIQNSLDFRIKFKFKMQLVFQKCYSMYPKDGTRAGYKKDVSEVVYGYGTPLDNIWDQGGQNSVTRR